MIKQFQNDDYMVAGNKVEHLSQFFFWGAWLSSTDRPGKHFHIQIIGHTMWMQEIRCLVQEFYGLLYL